MTHTHTHTQQTLSLIVQQLVRLALVFVPDPDVCVCVWFHYIFTWFDASKLWISYCFKAHKVLQCLHSRLVNLRTPLIQAGLSWKPLVHWPVFAAPPRRRPSGRTSPRWPGPRPAPPWRCGSGRGRPGCWSTATRCPAAPANAPAPSRAAPAASNPPPSTAGTPDTNYYTMEG